MHYVLDRVEGALAVLIADNGEIVTSSNPQLLLHHEGDLFWRHEEQFFFDPEETKKRNESVKARFHRLKKSK